ncbi:MAG: hypothetical protein ACO1PI_12600 [Bacteroidota bacterium]
MRNFLYVLIVLIFLSCNNEQYVASTDENLSLKDSLIYYKKMPFNGVIVDSLIGFNCYRIVSDGKGDSIVRCYYLSGELSSIVPMNGLLANGFVRYYEKNGMLSRIIQMTEDKYNGYYLEINNGNEKVEGYYKADKRDSVWVLHNFIDNHNAKDIIRYYYRDSLLIDLTSVLVDEMENKPDTQIRYEFDLKDTILKFKLFIDDWKLKNVEKLD